MGIIQILSIIVAITGAALAGISWYLSDKVISPDTLGALEIYEIEKKAGKLNEAEFNQYPIEEICIQSPYAYSLFGLWIPLSGSKKTVILCHGITYSLHGSVKYMRIFRSRGYNVLLYDHRNHGRSGGRYTTFGYFEKYDLKACVDWVLARTGPGAIVGTHGESLGAGVALQHAAIDPRIAFVIADCPFSDLFDLLVFRLNMDFHLPAFPLIYISDYVTWLRLRFHYKDVSPIRDLQGVGTPMLFIHGQNDHYIPKEMSQAMAAQKPDTRRIYLAPNAGHAQAFWNNQVEYELVVGQFLVDIDKEMPVIRQA
jgi:uncharacterized protein